MDKENLLSSASPEEAEDILRGADFPVDSGALTFVLDIYFKSGNNYRAYALIMDFFEIAETSEWFPQQPDKYILFIEGIYALMYSEKDIERTLRAASILAELYKGNNDRGIFALFGDLRKLCGNPVSNSTFFLIVKEAINAAVNIIESSIEEMPSDEDISLICRVLIYLSTSCSDREFALKIAERLYALYDCASDTQLYILRMLLPELERAFSTLHGALEVIDGEEKNIITRTLTECQKILFHKNTPKPLENQEVFRILTGDISENEYLKKVNERSKLAADIKEARESYDRSWLPEMRERYEALVTYFTTEEQDRIQYDETEHLCLVIGLIALWRDFDFAYVFEKIKPYAEELLALAGDCRHLPANSVNMVSTAFHTLSDVYAMDDDMNTAYVCFVRFLKYGNLYFKRVCMENDFDFFLAVIKDEYFFYHDVIDNAMYLLDRYDFNISELYIELCKRKNLVYMGEVWRQGNKNIAEVNRLLARDFTFDNIRTALCGDTVLIDFMYCRKWFTGEEYSDDSAEDKRNAYCIAFAVYPSGAVYRYYVGKAGHIADKLAVDQNGSSFDGSYKQYLYDRISWDKWLSDNAEPKAGVLEDDYLSVLSDKFVINHDAFLYFKEITERLLEQTTPQIAHAVICADGDLNSIAFASLPYKDGFITDYYSVKNIGSIYDIVYPRKRQALKNALIFNAPDFGNPGEWAELIGSEFEGAIIQNTLASEHMAVHHLSGKAATLNAVKTSLEQSIYDVVHFSTHGVFDRQAVGLIAAGTNMKDLGAILWDSDLRQFPSLSKTALITYALCFGAKQTSKLNDSLSGFIKSSLLSGVNAVIAPIYPIQDLSSAILLNEFYKSYISENPPELALKHAVKRLRTINKDALRDEYFIEIEDENEYPFAEPKHWSPWVCFSKEERIN